MRECGRGRKEAFIRAHTVIAHAPLVPEIALYLASELAPIWQASEDWLAARDISPPYWAFVWPGGQALARHILDHRSWLAGRRVLDFAAGSGIAAIAAAQAGSFAEAAETDSLAIAAIRLNARLNGAAVVGAPADLVGAPCRWDVILCGDVCYDAQMVAHILPWLQAMARVAEVWIADPGRSYLPRDGLTAVAAYEVPTTLELEDRTERLVKLYRLSASPP